MGTSILAQKTDSRKNDIDEILLNTHTVTRFLDDDIFVKDIEECFKDVYNKYKEIQDEIVKTGKIYLEFK